MSIIDRIVATFNPEAGLRRARARTATDLIKAHYSAAGTGRRAKTWMPAGTSADAAAMRRDRLAWITRDMIRNTPYAARAQQVIANNVVGDGIIPKVIAPTKALQKTALELIERHLDSVAIDADGVNNLYGLQRIIMNAVVSDGEALVIKRKRRMSDGLPLPLQIQVLESDYLDTARDGKAANGNSIQEGIEYDAIGKRVAYYIFEEHPGARVSWGNRTSAKRVPAADVVHVYRQDRPGQKRGTSWFASVALNLQDLGDHQDAQLMRQKIAACFAAFRTSMDEPMLDDTTAAEIASSLQPGAIMSLAPGEDIKFASPPKVDGFEEFTRVIMRSVAGGMGITYESLTGDLSGVNFSSARMGRMEMDRNISSWQWTMMIPQFLDRLGEWLLNAWMQQSGNTRVTQSRILWVPPHRVLVDPTREIPALGKKVSLGLASRSSVIRDMGYDPERVMEEIKADADEEKRLGLRFETSVFEEEEITDE